MTVIYPYSYAIEKAFLSTILYNMSKLHIE